MQNLKPVYRIYNVYAAFLVIIALFIMKHYSFAAHRFPALHNGVVYINPNETVPATGVIDFYADDSSIVYVSKNDNQLVAGVYSIITKKLIPVTIATMLDTTVINKITFDTKTIYVSTQDHTALVLYRVDVNQQLIQKIDDIIDFIVTPFGIAILRKDCTVTIDDVLIPLHFHTMPKFSGIVGERLIVVSDGTETELIDIVKHIAVHRLTQNSTFATSSEYNVEINISDIPFNEKSHRVFYKIYCNGEYFDRTQPALSINRSTVKLNILPGQYHEIILERWRLDETEDKYVRDNNIRQPKPLIVYVYSQRIIVATLTFNGIEYTINTSFKIEE